jgi:hypothetical protein
MFRGLTNEEVRSLSRRDMMEIIGDGGLCLVDGCHSVENLRALAILFYKKLHAACYVPSFVPDHNDFTESCCSPRRMFIRAHDARQKE